MSIFTHNFPYLLKSFLLFSVCRKKRKYLANILQLYDFRMHRWSNIHLSSGFSSGALSVAISHESGLAFMVWKRKIKHSIVVLRMLKYICSIKTYVHHQFDSSSAGRKVSDAQMHQLVEASIYNEFNVERRKRWK